MRHLAKKKLDTGYKGFNPWFFAIMLATLAYLLLYLSFTSTKKTKEHNTISRAPRIIMLPLGKQNNLRQNQLASWLRNDNPTLTVRPSRRYGYSSVLKPNYKLSADYASFDVNSVLAPLYFFSFPFEIRPFSIEEITPTQLFARLALSNNPEIPATPFSFQSPTDLSYPQVREYYSGTPISIEFKNRERVLELATKHSPQKPTILIVDVPRSSLYFPIVKTISSCGFSELDVEAMNSLILANLYKEKSLQGRQIKVYIEWRRED